MPIASMMRRSSTAGDAGGERRHHHLRQPGDDDRRADLKGAEAAHLRQKQRDHVGRAVKAGADDEGVERAEREVAVAEGAQVDDRLAVGQHAPEEQGRGDRRHDHGDADRPVVEPIPARAFLERVFEAAEKHRHQHQPGQVEIAQQGQIGLVDVDQAPHGGRHGDPRHDVDQEQPVPRQRVGQIAADRRSQGRRQVQDQRDDDHDRAELGLAELGVDHREDQRRDRAAAGALQGAVEDHLVEAGRGGAQRARGGEAERRDDEQDSRRQQPRQDSGHRHHHHVGDQIRGLHPGDLVGAGRQPALDLGQRAGDDLDVHDRHEQAGDHREDAEPVAQGRRRGAGRSRRGAPSGGDAAAAPALGPRPADTAQRRRKGPAHWRP